MGTPERPTSTPGTTSGADHDQDQGTAAQDLHDDREPEQPGSDAVRADTGPTRTDASGAGRTATDLRYVSLAEAATAGSGPGVEGRPAVPSSQPDDDDAARTIVVAGETFVVTDRGGGVAPARASTG